MWKSFCGRMSGGHLRPLAATRVAASGCKWLQVAAGDKRMRAATCGHLRPLEWLQVAAIPKSKYAPPACSMRSFLICQKKIWGCRFCVNSSLLLQFLFLFLWQAGRLSVPRRSATQLHGKLTDAMCHPKFRTYSKLTETRCIPDSSNRVPCNPSVISSELRHIVCSLTLRHPGFSSKQFADTLCQPWPRQYNGVAV